MIVKPRSILAGLRSYIPLLRRELGEARGEMSARYCYTVWMRHLVCLRANGVQIPLESLIELGPGSSLGVGLAGLLSGADRYIALDAIPFSGGGGNEAVLEELVELFTARMDIPGEEEFSSVYPKLSDYSFPHDILPPELLGRSLAPARIERIKASLKNNDDMIGYYAPWDCADVVEKGIGDIVFSQAVLEHVEDLDTAYSLMEGWLKDGGVISHSIDFGCHGLSDYWNGHWSWNDWLWQVVRGNREFLINRQPYARHAELMGANGFDILAVERLDDGSGLPKERLAPLFRDMSELDARTRGAYVLAVKAGGKR
ncbi:MAG: class I SAM-dependent methyltransferase [Pseudodesulfovibrio sp.]